MQLTLEILDGTYNVRIHAKNGQGLIPNGDGQTVIHNGMNFHKDTKGFIWESHFTILNDHQIEMITTVDPSHGGSAAFLIDASGNPTKSMVTYQTVLEASQENGVLLLQGDIHHSDSTTHITLAKKSDH